MLKTVNLYYKYPKSKNYAIQNVNIGLKEGEIYGVLGPNGSGKTTLLLLLAGILKPTRGQILLNGKPLHKQMPKARRQIGILFQDPEDQILNPIVYDEIAFTLRQILDSESEVERKIKETILKLGLNINILKRKTFELSYGQKKLIALASILAYNPKIILLDEPFSNLSKSYVKKLSKIIVEGRVEGKIIVLATHKVDEVYHLLDKVIILKDGRVMAFEDKESLLAKTEIFKEADLTPPTKYLTLKALKQGRIEEALKTLEESLKIA